MVVNMLDEVAWLFNLRGSDIDFNPVFFAYAVVTQDKAILFVNPEQVDDGVRKHLGDAVEIRPYDNFFQYLSGLGAELELSKKAQIKMLDDLETFFDDEVHSEDDVVHEREDVAFEETAITSSDRVPTFNSQ